MSMAVAVNENETRNGMVSIRGMNKQIRDARLALGLSQDRAAAYCGVAGMTFQRWEYGSTKSVRQEYYDKLLDILNGTAVMEDA